VARLRISRPPAGQVQDLVGQVKELKESDGAYAGDLTEEGAKKVLIPFNRGDGNGPEVSGGQRLGQILDQGRRAVQI